MQCVSMDALSKKCRGAAVKPLSLFKARPEDVPGPHAEGHQHKAACQGTAGCLRLLRLTVLHDR